MPRPRGSAPALRTAPVLAVLVCHDGATWLPEALAALGASTPRPRHVLAVDTGSLDETPRLLADALDEHVVDGVLTRDRRTGFATAVGDAVAAAVERWGDEHDAWIWVLHDDCAPRPDCLATLLSAAEASPAAGVLGPLALDWDDPRLVVEAGLSTDASGHRQTGIGPSELDWSRLGREHGFGQSTEVLAVPSAGMLVRRDLWTRLGGFDPEIPLLREDIDFGWRANRAGEVVLCVPSARLRHVRAVPARLRGAEARGATLRGPVRTLDRALGLRTFLVNCSPVSFLLGLPRLGVLCLVRALGFAMQRRLDECRAEVRALGYLFGGGARLREARRARRTTVAVHGVRGLFTSRLTRLRNAVRAAVAFLVRRRLQADAALGRLPDTTDLLPTDAESTRRPVGPEALPAGVAGRVRRPAGLRRPATALAVSLALPGSGLTAQLPPGLRPSPFPRPSPVPRDGSAPAPPDLVIVRVDRGRLARQVLLAPPVVLVVALLGLGLWLNAARLGTDLSGGRLLPAPDLLATWSSYLATWHPVAGGTAAPAPAGLAVLGGLGAVLAPVGGVPAVVAVLLLGDLPLAGLAAYVATRGMPVDRRVRALVAAAYALVPTATAAVAQGRLDVVVAHILLPPVTAGVIALLGRRRTESTRWLSTAAASAFGLAVLGAFAPLVHLLLVGYALAGFVLVPGRRGDGRRRVTALFLLVLMPLALLLPWPAVLIQHPGAVLHGVGATVAPVRATITELVTLDPGGPGAWPYVGLLVVIAALVALVLRPRRTALPGLALALLGGLAVALVHQVPAAPLTGGPAQPGWAGAALLVVAWGLLLALLAACRTGPEATPAPAGGYGPAVRVTAVLGVAAVLALAAGAVLAGRDGPLADEREPLLATTLLRELAATGRSVLVLPHDGEPARMAAGRVPGLGDDDLAPVNAGTSLDRLADSFRSSSSDGARRAVAEAAAAGVLFVVPPSAADGARLTEAAGDLVASAPATPDGRPVLRLQPAAAQVTLLSPEQARRAITASPPPTELGAPGIVPVEASPPAVAVRVSDGPAGRLLVLAAEEEPGWQATVDGRPVPVVRAWGHLVGVSVPVRAADVRVEQPTALRSVLLLTQAAMVLFVLLTAIPGRREPIRPR